MSNMKQYNNEKSLDDCSPGGLPNSQNIDPIPKECSDDGWPSQKRVARNPQLEWQEKPSLQPEGVQYLGQSGLCDPIQTGEIINDLDTPNREVIYRYTRALRGANEAMYDMFRNTKIIDEDGKAHVVPIIWASPEKAVAAILQDNVRKDNSLVVDRIRLPIMAIYASGHALDLQRFTYQRAISLFPWASGCVFTGKEKCEKDTIFGVTRGLPVDIQYKLYVWTLYQEDMDQILEQVMLKFSPVAYIRVKGVWWEIIVTMDSMANNLDIEPGDAKIRVLKYEFGMTAKSYIPQPLVRMKPPIDNPFDLVKKDLTPEELENLASELEI